MPNQPKQNNEGKQHLQKSKVMRILFAAFAAFFLWFYVITEVRTEIEVKYSNVQVEFEGLSVLEDRNLKVISSMDVEVDLKLYGQRAVLNGLRSSDLTVRVDLTTIHEAGSRGVAYEIVYPDDVSASGIEVVSRTPDLIEVNVVSWAEKRVNVLEPIITGDPGEGFRLGAINSEDWTPKTIKVAGPKAVIERIRTARLVVDVEGISESKEIRKSFTYYDSDGNVVMDAEDVQASPEQGEVDIQVLMEKEVDMKLPLAIDKNLLDTEYTITATIKLTDGTEQVISGVLFNSAEGLETQSNVFDGIADGRPHLNLGKVLAYGSMKSMEMCTEAQLPELTLTDIPRKEYTAQDFDIYQDGSVCEVQSVVVTVSTREMTTQRFDVTIENEGSFQFTVSRPAEGIQVELRGFADDLAKVTKDDIVALIPTGTVVGDTIVLDVALSEELQALGITVVYVTPLRAQPNISFTGTGGQI